MIPLGAWEPDSFYLNDQKVSEALGVYPTPNGWGPVPDVAAISSALGAKCVGAVALRSGTNSYQIYAGTATKLYRYNATTTGWDDLSGAKTFAVPDGDYWSFALFGTYLLATNLTDGLYEIDVTSGTAFAATAGSPPKARFVTISGDFVVLACLSTAEDTMQWSALNDRTGWTVGTDFSDIQLFPDGGSIRAIAGGEIGLVFQEDTIRRMTLVGGSQIFTFSVLARNKRLRAPYSMIQLGGIAYAIMDHGVCAYTQSGEQQIGVGKVDRWLQETIDKGWWPRTVGCSDPTATRIYWAFRSVDNSANTWFDKILVYDYVLQRFSLIGTQTDFIFPAATAGFTLEGLDAFGTLETLPASLDSAVWGGGTPNFGQFSSAHVLGFRSGSNIDAYLTTTDMQVSGARATITGVYPLSDNATDLRGSIAGKASPSDAYVWPDWSVKQSSGWIRQRKDARFHSIRFWVPSASVWTYINGYDVESTGSGAR